MMPEDRLNAEAKFTVVVLNVTVRPTVVVWVRLPEVPVMVTVDVPVAAVLLAVSVNMLVPVALEGLKDAVTPLGNPEADKLTLPLKPFSGLTVMLLLPVEPCATVRLPGETDKLKSGAAIEPGGP
jgi:hypothetical protein